MRQPENYSFVPAKEWEKGRKRVAKLMRCGGVVFVRITAVNRFHQPVEDGDILHGYWVEGWETHPLKNPTTVSHLAPFSPPLSLAKGPLNDQQ